jgi:HK97 family phage major capsid protein
LSERILDLREREDRKMAGVMMTSRAPSAGDTSGLVHVRTEPAVYAPADARGGERVSFFRDLMHSQVGGDPTAEERLRRHELQLRAAGTTTTGAGAVPPTWLFGEFAILAHGPRPWADTLRLVPIENANPVNIGVETSGAVVAAQVNQNDPPTDGSFVTSIVTVQPSTLTGKVDVSRQLVDGSNPSIDGLIYADAMGSYAEAVETLVVNALEALTPPVIVAYPGTYTNLPDVFVDVNASVVKRRKAPASTVLLSAGAWAFLGKQKDTAGRPLITTGTFTGPTNAYGVGQPTQYEHLAGEVVGLQIIPSWAGVDNHLYVLKADDSLLLESSTFNFRYEEVLGPSSIRLGVWGYAAPVLARYPGGIARINAGTTIPAPAGADDEPAAIEAAPRK